MSKKGKVLALLSGIVLLGGNTLSQAGALEELIAKLEEKGILSPEEYEAATRDLTAFLVYVAEPAQLQRKTMGVWVLLFLFIFTFVAYLLKKEYWKDVEH